MKHGYMLSLRALRRRKDLPVLRLIARSRRQATSPRPTEIDGTIQFYVSDRVTTEEMAGWEPARIASFFAGIAQATAARNGVPDAGP
jgi:hypothetical protein